MLLHVKPETRIAARDYTPSVMRRLLDLVCNRFTLHDDQARFSHLLHFDKAEIESALRGPGLRRNLIDAVILDHEQARMWTQPIGERTPFSFDWQEGLQSDEDAKARRNQRLHEPNLGVWMAPSWLRLVRRLLKESDYPEAPEVMEGMAHAFERADEDYATHLDATPKEAIEWKEQPGGYYLRVPGDSTFPDTPVYRRWDGTIGVFNVTIIQARSRVGVGAYRSYLDIDKDYGEAVTWDEMSFDACERNLIEKLKLRFPMVRKGGFIQRNELPEPAQRLNQNNNNSEDE